LATSAFFVPALTRLPPQPQRTNQMHEPQASMAQQIARAATAFEQERTGHAPTSVTVVLSDDALVIALRGALSEAEKAVARDPDGAAKVQEFHRQLFATAAGTLRREIERITGAKVREASAEIEPRTGTVVNVFATGTVVQVFLLASRVATDVYRNERKPEKR
jgi:uncharacterized protein YbcI